MHAELRADIHNAFMPRQSNPWTAEEFGARYARPVTSDPRATTMTPEKLRLKMISMYGPDGDGTTAGQSKISIVRRMRDNAEGIAYNIPEAQRKTG